MAEMPPGYDAWKTRTPYDEYDEPCDHPDYLHQPSTSGACRCGRCGEEWQMTEAEIAEHRLNSPGFDEAWRDEEKRARRAVRRALFDYYTRPLRRWLYRVTRGWLPERVRNRIEHIDDIPF